MNRMVDGNTDVWLFELERRLFRRFTFGPGPDLVPLWSPDGKRLLYSVGGGTEGFVLTEKLVDGIGDEEPIAGLDAPRGIVTDLSINGFVLSGTDRRFDQRDVYAVPLDGGKRIAVATTSFVEVPGEFSPDGRWVTYMSNESGRSDVFVQSFPDPAQRLLVSSGGGVHPRFSPDGGEIFYLAADSRLMAVTLRRRADATLDADAPVPLFTAPLSGSQEGGNFGEYVVADDGNRFLLNALIEQTSAPLQLVLDRPSAAGPSNATAR
jgi:dipeptidyl aminopeptidase/acylaminoacyl peptidase